MRRTLRSSASSASPRHVSTTINARLSGAFESGLPYSMKLSRHTSCVNVLAFSHGEGRWLASAGDDLVVMLWDFHQENIDPPAKLLFGHFQNIFCLEFSAHSQYLYSGAVDMRVIKYDISTGLPCADYSNHTASVRGISAHPENDEIILTASEDGTVQLHDARVRSTGTHQPAGTLQNQCELTDVRYHPVTDKLFLTADNRGNVCLRDARMAFDSGARQSGGGTVLKYVTGLSRRSVPYVTQPEAASIAIDRDGKKFAVTFLHYLPTIYDTADLHPLAVCGGRALPDGSPVPPGQRTYSNACTMKHGSFGGPSLAEDIYYTAGSDDFRAYVWKMPDLAELREQRRVINVDDWKASEERQTIGFTARMSDDRYVPVELRPLFRLNGHDSIINTSLIHPCLPHVATAGVERHVLIHSAFPSTPFAPAADSSASAVPSLPSVPSVPAASVRPDGLARMRRTKEEVRELPPANAESTRRYAVALVGGPLVEGRDGETEAERVEASEQRTIDFFDGVLREHQDVNVFTAGRMASDSDDSEGGDNESDSESDVAIYD